MELKNIDDIDELKLYFGYPYFINDKITIYHPTLGEIIDMGESKYFQMIHVLTGIPSDMKSMLWDIGIDYETISDFELFRMLAPSLSPKYTDILFHGVINFINMKQYINPVNNEIVLADIENDVVIDEYVYLKMVLYLRKMHRLTPKVERAGTKKAKDLMILLDRQDRAKAQTSAYSSKLFPLISSLLNTPGFKYKKSELAEVHYFEFLDCVQRISAIKSADALLQGVYAGQLDGKKIKKEQLDWLRDLSK